MFKVNHDVANRQAMRYRVQRVARHRKTRRFMHMSGDGLTDNRTYAWTGTKEQFVSLCLKRGLMMSAYSLKLVSQENAET